MSNNNSTNKTEYRLTTEERQTYLWYDEVDDKWRASSSIKRHISKFRRSGWTEIRTEKYKDGSDCLAEFEAPEFAVTFRKPVKKTVSDERKKAMSENMRKRMSKVENT